jgi:transcriptional regulator with XRE-family HTH domain
MIGQHGDDSNASCHYSGNMTDRLTARLAATVRDTRSARGLSVAALAELSGVSRAMIGKIERGEAQPTAALLGRLSAALGSTLTDLIARAEGDDRRLVRTNEQAVWTDPDTGYRRRAVSPPHGGPLDLVEVELPAGARVAMPAGAYAFNHHQIWVLEGHLRFHEGDEVHELDAGDCLQLGPPAPCAYANPTNRPCRYLVAVVKRAP